MLIFSKFVNEEPQNKLILAVAGPTASGKTALGVELALRLDGEVVNFDSVQIYRGIEIATAKPTAGERRGVPHHLIDYVDPNVNYTAADWSRDAAEKITEIEGRGKVPILVGGTGFYLRSLMQPLFDAPSTDRLIRDRLKKIREKRGAEFLHRLLTKIDPAAAGNVFARDYVRVTRALEFYFQTG
ncbi:MAG: tRNA (adenosine(37)-N6)-dimethylallyltransferase MiaA, partial [Acidobacteriota bacterium]